MNITEFYEINTYSLFIGIWDDRRNVLEGANTCPLPLKNLALAAYLYTVQTKYACGAVYFYGTHIFNIKSIKIIIIIILTI